MEPNQFTILSSVPDVGMCSLLEEVSAVHSLRLVYASCVVYASCLVTACHS